jgi:hypothetical protein
VGHEPAWKTRQQQSENQSSKATGGFSSMDEDVSRDEEDPKPSLGLAAH